MIYDLTDRLIAAGITNNAVGEHLQNQGVSVFNFDDNDKFDQVKFHRDFEGRRIEYIFGYDFLSENFDKYFAPPPFLNFSRSKTIIVTEIDNVDYQVVERFATQPFDISFKGLIIDLENHLFPLKKLQELNEIFDYNGIWGVASEILNAVGITSIYFESVNIDFLEGFADTVAYDLKAKQIKEIHYQLT